MYVDKRDIDNIRRRVLNIEKIRRVLRWVPTTTLTNGLGKTFEWLRSSRIKPRTRKVVVKVHSAKGVTG